MITTTLQSHYGGAVVTLALYCKKPKLKPGFETYLTHVHARDVHPSPPLPHTPSTAAMATNGHTDAHSVDFTPLGIVERPANSAIEAILWFDIGAQAVPGRAYASFADA